MGGQGYNLSPWGGGANGWNLSAPLGKDWYPKRGIIAIGVDLEDDIEARAPKPAVREMIEWVNDKAHNGKIRFNVHGSDSGTLAMKDSAQAWSHSDAGNAAHWLIANGLEGVKGRTITRAVGIGRGLTTVAFAICMGGRSGMEAAPLNLLRTRTRSQPVSTISKFVGVLRGHDVRGVKVTGSNEIVSGWEGNWGRSVQLPVGWALRQQGPERSWLGRGIIEVPDPFEIERQKGTIARGVIRYPADCATRHFPGNRDEGWPDGIVVSRGGQDLVLIPDTGWIVDRTARVIKPPVGWFVKAKPRGRKGGEIRFTLKSVELQGRSYFQRLTRTPYKVRMYT
jgi:hypothetical protein